MPIRKTEAVNDFGLEEVLGRIKEEIIPLLRGELTVECAHEIGVARARDFYLLTKTRRIKLFWLVPMNLHHNVLAATEDENPHVVLCYLSRRDSSIHAIVEERLTAYAKAVGATTDIKRCVF